MDRPTPRSRARARAALSAFIAAGLLAPLGAAAAQAGSNEFTPGNLIVSRSVYLENPSLGLYPFVWNNDLIDASFGITSRIFLDEITPLGALVGTLEVPNSTQNGVPTTKDQLVTSFSSKSELALNLSTDGSVVTFLGYASPVNAIDVSNTNTPAIFDPTNPVTGSAFRAVALLDQHGKFKFTLTNAYSGNNGRAAILHNSGGANSIFTAGNAGNGANPQPAGIILAAGTQIIQPEQRAMIAQQPSLPTPVGSFNITQLGEKPDKIGKDDNFRGLTIFNDASGGACPNGSGLPQPGAALPDSPLAYDPSVLEAQGLPSNMCILRGFPSTINSKLKKKTTAYPFGIWFADSKTAYVADEGDGDLADAGQTPAGLQKWIFDDVSASWKLAYTMQTGLGLGSTYSFPGDADYPTGNNPATGQQWAPVTDGLRNITGRVNGDGTVTIW